MNIDIWVIGTFSQVFIRGSYAEIKNNSRNSTTNSDWFFPYWESFHN